VDLLEQTAFVDGEDGDVVSGAAHALRDCLVDRPGYPPRERREDRLGLADGVAILDDGGGDVEEQVALLAAVVVVGDALRQTRELPGTVLDHAELGHQRAVSRDLVRDFVDVAVAVVEGLPVVHRLPFDADLGVLVDTARGCERLRPVLLGEVHDGQRVVVAPELDRERAGVRGGEEQVLVALDRTQRLVRADDRDDFGDGSHGGPPGGDRDGAGGRASARRWRPGRRRGNEPPLTHL